MMDPRSSFVDLAGRRDIRKIEIPIIQRDYAQGRRDATVIRERFLEVLARAVSGSQTIHLDFVYGTMKAGTLVPLDGQQRLTALFLLHWYVGARAAAQGADVVAQPFPMLTYETRRTARHFCEKLVGLRPFPLAVGRTLEETIRDQSWFMSAWRHDPTIDSMLVVLEDLHRLLEPADPVAAWKALVDEEASAITFDFLSIDDLGLTDELYIKMNARGKPLTEFESFKAELEAFVRERSESRYETLCKKIDNEWSDVFWKMRERWQRVIDDLFLRYFRFVTDTLGQAGGIALEGDDLARARAVYGANEAHLDALFASFDTWCSADAREWFASVFTPAVHEDGKVAIFDDVDLLHACCASYRYRDFALAKLLLLFAVVHHRRTRSEGFAERVRVLRNLVFNSPDEIRHEDLPSILPAVSELVASGKLPERGFNRRQLAEEAAKAAFVANNAAAGPPIRRLEDHPLLRGCLTAFDMAAPELDARAVVFDEIFPRDRELPVAELKAALLACGDYSQRLPTGRFQFGADVRKAWRELFTRDAAQTRAAVARLLDAARPTEGDGRSIAERLRAVTRAYLSECEEKRAFDWRYYVVKYDEMRSGVSGIYGGSSGPMSFRLCMLDKRMMHSKYRDPFLLAIYRRSAAARDPHVAEPKFTGPASDERWLDLARGGMGVTCTEEGFRLRPPGDERAREMFDQVTEQFGVSVDGHVRVPQRVEKGVAFDSEDRVELGARLVGALVEAI